MTKAKTSLSEAHEHNLLNRELFLIGDITDEAFTWFWRSLRFLETKPAPITIHLRTEGGEELAMWAVHDAIRASENEITVIGIGEIASAGALLLACADVRLVTPNAVIMCHETSYPLGGMTNDQLEARLTSQRWLSERWFSLMAEYSNHAEKWWKARVTGGLELWLMGAEQIIEAGLADRVYSVPG